MRAGSIWLCQRIARQCFLPVVPCVLPRKRRKCRRLFTGSISYIAAIRRKRLLPYGKKCARLRTCPDVPKAIWYPAETSDERIEAPHSDEKNETIENAKRICRRRKRKSCPKKTEPALKPCCRPVALFGEKSAPARRRMPDCRVMPLHAFDHGQTVSFAVFPVAGENIRFFEGCRL